MTRPSEPAPELPDPELSERLRVLCPAAASLLAINVACELPGYAVERVARPGQVDPTRSYDAAVWRVDGELQRGLGVLRRQLQPAACVVLVLAARDGLLHRLQALIARNEPPRVTAAELCEALLLRGFLEPRVDMRSARVLVSARVPAITDELDDFFKQPDAAESR